ncbi:MAG: Na+/H+ antiporter subunit E [Cyclobacteriaceae bacterium]
MVYLINILLAVVISFFIVEAIPKQVQSALMIIGIFLGNYSLLWVFSFFYSKSHFRKVPQILALFFYYLRELVKASLRVTYDVITPTHHMNPGVVAFKMKAKTPLEITLLANFITLTPGSLSIDLAENNTVLYIHETYIKDGDIEKFKEKLRNGFEKRILKVTR